MQRLQPGFGIPGQPADVPIELVELSLVSIDPVQVGKGQFEHLFIGLNDNSQGQMAIHLDEDGQGGQYQSQIQVNYVVRVGDPFVGPIFAQDTAILDLLGEPGGQPGFQPWGRKIPPDAWRIKGVNYRLNPPMTTVNDFWPGQRRNGWGANVCNLHGEAATAPANHCINHTPQDIKWSQLPEFQFGENIPSDVDWRDIMNPDGPQLPNWVVADDFRSNGQPITNIRWWGSYFNPDHQPRPEPDPFDLDSFTFVPTVEDGFIISFFRDVPADQNPNGRFSQPGELIGSYITSEVHIKPTEIIGWDQHPVWEYEVELEDTHPDHLLSGVTTPQAFFEKKEEIYWVSIAAENGHELVKFDLDPNSWEFRDTGDNREDMHFWGWHTSPKIFNDVPTQGDLVMPEMEWRYGNWHPIDPQHSDPNHPSNMAFELLTQPKRHPCDFTGDLMCNIDDINDLYNAANHNLVAGAGGFLGDPRDLDGDGVLTNHDLTLWLEFSGHFNGWNTPFRRGDTDEVGHMPNRPPMDKRDVDITDFNTLSNHFSSHPTLIGPPWEHGNFDGNRTVDITDFNWLAFNFSPAGYTPSVIPEPSTMLLVALAGGMLSLLGWRSRR